MLKNSFKFKVKIAIIGGSGVYDAGIFKKEREIKIKTPFGYPSSPIEIGDFLGTKIAFLARHGRKHQFPPHKVPQKANIWALNKLGVERIIGICAVGSLKKEFKPGDIVIPDQFIDFTKSREYTFYDGSTSSPQAGAIHVSLADPFCPELRSLFCKEAAKLKISNHKTGTYFCVEGPRFSTRAESRFFRNFADIIGMTLVPEAVLARELEICYLSLAAVTDYDVWAENPVSAKEVIKTMANNLEKIKKLLKAAIPRIKEGRSCFCKDALKSAKI
ncbi:MAG: methylthioadenosine phosphorylase [Candidatus Nealsonbacteria bacterium RIFCSPLOWO2_01_FULL_41_9]|uniref:S-methyl-5'-thioadenosine phosphorylase n=1 Tax=Candidatus Nealsonbacteria bacterium RIFCSPLOWO2_01_FULL_41_9 TaxID=1801671 RepID=A0A1G2EC70_9BACT|nr:MAG: methylthioadenosine phosphorylase [Candidatus Nealsonbacteria bacterium RIFCSPLOWO2_01_FULL_41_9]